MAARAEGAATGWGVDFFPPPVVQSTLRTVMMGESQLGDLAIDAGGVPGWRPGCGQAGGCSRTSQSSCRIS